MNTTIFNYILVAISALAITPFMTAMIKRYSEEKKIFTKDFMKDVTFDWKIALITPIVIVALLYYYGISIKFFLFSILTIILIMEACVDVKAQILPNSLNFVGFLIGIVYTFFVFVYDVMNGLNLLLGMITGAGIFLLIAAFALIVYKREGMGLGDVKLMGMLGLFFGTINTIQIFVLSFFIGAIISIILLVTKIKKTTDYIAFGPFIVISAVFTMFIPASVSMVYVNALFSR